MSNEIKKPFVEAVETDFYPTTQDIAKTASLFAISQKKRGAQEKLQQRIDEIKLFLPETYIRKNNL